MSTVPSAAPANRLSMELMLLIANGFAIVYAFATETIYAMFLKDIFGHGEHVLSMLFAINGIFIGIFQVFFIKPIVSILGKHGTLALGNLLLALGMLGVACVRSQRLHFMLFATHVVGYSIADTALASLISRYSADSSQGQNLSMNQAAQSFARVISPLFAGMLYERSKHLPPWMSWLSLPEGALPFLVGAIGPAVAIAVPLWLSARRRQLEHREAREP